MKAVRIIAILAVASALLAAIPANADDDLPYLARIAIERMPDAAETFGRTIVSTLHVNDVGKVANALSYIDGLDVVATATGTVEIAFREAPTLTGDPEARFQQSSWVVDYEDAAVQNLVTSLHESRDRPVSARDLERFVYDHISNKTYSRAFDLASRVAASSEGDCTEHAVLLAALARANGHYARVVFGNLIIDSEDGLAAFGHAWTEVHDGTEWQIFDATLPGRAKSVRQYRYLPLAALDNESPGYLLSMMHAMAIMPARISRVGNLP
ncbi:MAG: transglutaminase domain-containing protein [Woeseiaceae bacterium]|nr:transglutaminase domain-containing protein [Woeseiaceae bacterium]